MNNLIKNDQMALIKMNLQSTTGALRSLVTVFFNLAPLWIWLNRAPRFLLLGGGADPDFFEGAAGGGGGPGGGGGGGGISPYIQIFWMFSYFF